MTRLQQIIVYFAALIVLLTGYLSFRDVPAKSSVASLSVLFLGMTNNPVWQSTAPRVVVSRGVTGLCALFLVTNVTARQSLWFNTTSIEQKTEAGWKTFVPTGSSWSAIGGGLWSPKYGCLVSVGWPPGLATNATWRLKVSYGRDPSPLGNLINQNTGHGFFPSGKEEAIISSTDVSQ
jgi:hypothetical protein